MECMCPILGRPTRVEPTPFSRENWTIVRCCESGFVFLANPPSYDSLEHELAWEDLYHTEKRRREQEEPTIHRLSEFAKSAKHYLFPRRNKFFTLARAVVPAATTPIRCLDVGCGWGHLMEDLHGRFARIGRKLVPYGIEVSHRLARISGERFERLGGDVIPANALQGIQDFVPDSLDLVIMSSFLEHEAQPLVLLQRLHPLLSNDGAILLKVPNFGCWNRVVRGRRWCGFRFPDHVNYFTPRTLRRLAETAGFTVYRQGLLERLPLSDNMYAVLRKPRLAVRRAA
ncbi:MAG: class I SAM-dependent methyltransferase [Pirellulaceae bacterium]